MANRIATHYSQTAHSRTVIMLVAFATSVVGGYAATTRALGALAATCLVLVAVAILWRRPAWLVLGLLALSLAIPTSHLTTTIFSIRVFGYHILWTDLLVGLLVLRWFMNASTRQHRSDQSAVGLRFRRSVVLLLFWTAGMVLWSLTQERSLDIILYDVRPLVYYIALFPITDFIDQKRHLNQLTWTLLFGLVLHSVFTLSYLIIPETHPLAAVLGTQSGAYRDRITFSNDNLLIIAMPLTLVMLTHRSRPVHQTLFLYSTLALFTTRLIVSLGRGNTVLVMLGVMLSVLTARGSSDKNTPILLSAVRLVLYACIVVGTVYISANVILPLLMGTGSTDLIALFVSRFVGLRTEQGQAAHLVPRITMFRTALQVALQNPIVGHGFGFTFDLEGWSAPVTFIDSTWATLWIRLGLVGLILLLNMLRHVTSSVMYGLRLDADSETSDIRSLYSSLVGGGIALLVHSAMNAWIVNSTAVLPLLIVLGGIVGLNKGLHNDRYSDDLATCVHHIPIVKQIGSTTRRVGCRNQPSTTSAVG